MQMTSRRTSVVLRLLWWILWRSSLRTIGLYVITVESYVDSCGTNRSHWTSKTTLLRRLNCALSAIRMVISLVSWVVRTSTNRILNSYSRGLIFYRSYRNWSLRYNSLLMRLLLYWLSYKSTLSGVGMLWVSRWMRLIVANGVQRRWCFTTSNCLSRILVSSRG